jgi:hypothetical protein
MHLPEFRAIVVAVSLVVSSTAASADMIGLGNQSCGAWAANSPMQGGLGLLYQQWAFGSLSGVSYDGPSHDPLKGMDAPSIMQWLGDYCQRNPTVNIAAAASAFAQAHHP